MNKLTEISKFNKDLSSGFLRDIRIRAKDKNINLVRKFLKDVYVPLQHYILFGMKKTFIKNLR